MLNFVYLLAIVGIASERSLLFVLFGIMIAGSNRYSLDYILK